MVFQHEALNVDARVGSISAEVEHKFQLADVESSHVALPETLRLAGLQLNFLGKVEHVVVACVNKFHHDSRMIGA